MARCLLVVLWYIPWWMCCSCPSPVINLTIIQLLVFTQHKTSSKGQTNGHSTSEIEIYFSDKAVTVNICKGWREKCFYYHRESWFIQGIKFFILNMLKIITVICPGESNSRTDPALSSIKGKCFIMS